VDGKDLVGVLLQLVDRHRRHELGLLGVGAHGLQDEVAILLGLRDVLFRLPETAHQAGNGGRQGGGTDGDSGHGGKRGRRNPGRAC